MGLKRVLSSPTGTIDWVDQLRPVSRACLIVAAGVLVRLILLLVVDPATHPFGGDFGDYLKGAQRIWDGHLPPPYRPPLYSCLLAITLPLGWAFPLVVQSALTIGGALAALITFKGRIGFFTGLLIAACPFLALFDFRLLSETLYVQLGWLGFLLLYRRSWLSAGAVLGCAVLARDTLALLPLVVGVFHFFTGRQRALLVPLVAYALVVPWITASAGTSPGRAGINLWLGTWERNGEWAANGFEHPNFPPYAFRNDGERQLVERAWLRNDRALLNLAIERAEQRPAATVMTWIQRYPHLWIGTRSDQTEFRAGRWSVPWVLLKLLFLSLDLCLLAFGMWGFLAPDGYDVFVVSVVYSALIYIPFHTEIRFSLPALPPLLLLGVQRLTRGEEQRSDAPSRPSRSAGELPPGEAS